MTFPSGSSNLAWSGITKLGQTDRHLFVFIAPNQAIVVPGDSLQGCTLAALSAELRKHVGGRPRRFQRPRALLHKSNHR
jgi:hypothetical protein